ncbi:MAG: hypothetical protein H6574_17735 [Lewinellaceae bacterium]|nr:hypothetical protein [Saprospiraceae bacterium]MCB9316822.1 hypothetical protein [Lewinellaceae bacterium]MCB9332912.1 hypothetical protein [Lewinellaceae bacterium]
MYERALNVGCVLRSMLFLFGHARVKHLAISHFIAFKIYNYHSKYFLMKKFMFKTRLGLLVLLGVLAFGLTEVSAQQLPKQTQDVNWIPADDAVSIVNQEIATLDQQLQMLPSQALELKHKFYLTINELLSVGATVPDALLESYNRFVQGASDSPVVVPNSLSVATWQSYYNEAAQMLQN